MEVRCLAARGQLVKITSGRYALPVRSRFGTRPPAPESVTQLNLEGAQQLVSNAAAAVPPDAPPCAAAPRVGCPAVR
jgi:hypothetical protein